MKIKLLMIIFLVVCKSYSQTKLETQEWIKEKIELYAFKLNYVVEFENENMLLTIYFKYGERPDKFEYTIPIKELSKIRFEDKTNNTWLILQIKNGKKLIKYVNSIETSMKRKIELPLSKSLDDLDLKKRMSKAFTHLIELYGGKLAEEKF